MSHALWWSKKFKKKHFWIHLFLNRVRSQTHLHTASQRFMQNVCSLLHQFYIIWRRVRTLAIHDGVNEAIAEFLACSEQIRLHKVHHAVIYITFIAAKSCQNLYNLFLIFLVPVHSTWSMKPSQPCLHYIPWVTTNSYICWTTNRANCSWLIRCGKKS